MPSLPPLVAATCGDLALARADLALPPVAPEILLKEVPTVDDRTQATMVNCARSIERGQARIAHHAARLENMQAGLRRLMGGRSSGPAVVAVMR